MKHRNPLGWGYLEDAATDAERSDILATLDSLLGATDKQSCRPAPEVDGMQLPECETTPPENLRDIVSNAQEERLLHAVGRSFRDLAVLRTGSLPAAPAAVARPADTQSLARVLDWAQRENLAVIPFGGGSSVVSGVTPQPLSDGREWLSIDLQAMNRVREIETTDRVVEAEAGILGPDLDQALRPAGLTVRHYPQSYYHSTLGGWVATRGAGHYSTLHTKIEDRVQALQIMLADGSIMETTPFPASSVGPDPNRLWCGSEGMLGIITSVRLRVHARPEYRESVALNFPDFESALEAGRCIVQAGIWPAQMRILDPLEHILSAAMSGKGAAGALMILGFESASFPVGESLRNALEIARGQGGTAQAEKSSEQRIGDWRQAYFRQPYMRDVLLDYAVIADTFETAMPWHLLPGFYHEVMESTQKAVDEVCGSGGVTCRLTHAYSDGACLYFSFYGTGRHDSLLQQWQELKSAASDAVSANGGTISHHHAMGRDHKPWAKKELPAAFRTAIGEVKQTLDPEDRFNPGLWFSPETPE